MPTSTLWRLELFLFEEVVSASIEMDDLDGLSAHHLPMGQRLETWSLWCPVLGSLASALIAESSSKQRASN